MGLLTDDECETEHRAMLAMLRVLTPEEAGAVLGLAPVTVRKYVRQGLLAGYRQRYRNCLSRLVIPGWSLLGYQQKRCAELLEKVAARDGKSV